MPFHKLHCVFSTFSTGQLNGRIVVGHLWELWHGCDRNPYFPTTPLRRHRTSKMIASLPVFTRVPRSALGVETTTLANLSADFQPVTAIALVYNAVTLAVVGTLRPLRLAMQMTCLALYAHMFSFSFPI